MSGFILKFMSKRALVVCHRSVVRNWGVLVPGPLADSGVDEMKQKL